MNKKPKKPPSNNITDLRKKRGLTLDELSTLVGISKGQLSRLENGKSGKTGIKPKWLLKLAAAFKVPTHEVVSIQIEKKLHSKGDDVLIGEAIGWLLEASEEMKVDIPQKQLSQLVSLIYKDYVEKPLNFQERKDLAFMAVKVYKISHKA